MDKTDEDGDYRQGHAITLRSALVSAEERRAGAAAMGRARTEAKRAAAVRNGFKPGNTFGGRRALPLEQIECRCTAGVALQGHHWACPRGQAIKRRTKAGITVIPGN